MVITIYILAIIDISLWFFRWNLDMHTISFHINIFIIKNFIHILMKHGYIHYVVKMFSQCLCLCPQIWSALILDSGASLCCG